MASGILLSSPDNGPGRGNRNPRLGAVTGPESRGGQSIDHQADGLRRRPVEARKELLPEQRKEAVGSKAGGEQQPEQAQGAAEPALVRQRQEADAAGPKHLTRSVSRAKFEQLIEPIVERLRGPCEQALRDANVSPSALAKLTSRRGEIVCKVDTKGRNKPPEGLVFVPWFDAGRLVNKLTLDQTDPLSKETDYKKCGVKITRA